MRRTKIKICGNTSKQDALRLAYLPINALGFIVTKKNIPSKIDAELAAEIIAELPPFVTSVLGISLQHNSLKEIINLCHKLASDTLQVQHGGTVNEIKTIRQELPWIKIIKVVNVFDKVTLDQIKPFFEIANMFLIDNKGKSKEECLPFEEYLQIGREIVQISPKPVMLAGGLDSSNVKNAIKIVRPYAVDLISGVETIPGQKDFKKVDAFIKAVWEADKKIYRES